MLACYNIYAMFGGCRNKGCKRGLPILEDGLCRICYSRRFVVDHPEWGRHEYIPSDKQLEFHTCPAPNCLQEGARGTGKSFAIRNDAHIRALAVPGLTYLILRRTMPELRKTHIRFIRQEMQKLGGTYNKQEGIAYYPNGSMGFFSHCETEDDMMKLLSSEYVVIYFDEMSTFTQEQITKISTCARVPEGSGLTALVRGGTNPLGVGAEYILNYYIAKQVDPLEDDEYNPNDYVAIRMLMSDNPFIDETQYRKKFSGLPAHVRAAWLDAEWAIEGAYFADFRPKKLIKNANGVDVEVEWHVISKLPAIEGKHLSQVKWLQVYRSMDWGFFPDPAVCLWIAVLPNGREIVFDEETWFKTTAKDVAIAVKNRHGEVPPFHIVDTTCDPTMFSNSEATGHSVGDIVEMNGVALFPSKNDRAAAGFAIHEHLNTVLDDGLPKLQFYKTEYGGARMLCKTIPTLRMDEHDSRKIGDGNDHWVIALAYFCMTLTGASKQPLSKYKPKWMRFKGSTGKPNVLGRHNVRSKGRR